VRGWHAAGNGREVTGLSNAFTAGPNKCVIVTRPLLGDSSGSYMVNMFGQVGLDLVSIQLPEDLGPIREAAANGTCLICTPPEA
jgi:hypothetical protein